MSSHHLTTITLSPLLVNTDHTVTYGDFAMHTQASIEQRNRQYTARLSGESGIYAGVFTTVVAEDMSSVKVRVKNGYLLYILGG